MGSEQFCQTRVTDNSVSTVIRLRAGRPGFVSQHVGFVVDKVALEG
jgi:hypothetical protein